MLYSSGFNSINKSPNFGTFAVMAKKNNKEQIQLLYDLNKHDLANEKRKTMISISDIKIVKDKVKPPFGGHAFYLITIKPQQKSKPTIKQRLEHLDLEKKLAESYKKAGLEIELDVKEEKEKIEILQNRQKSIKSIDDAYLDLGLSSK